MKINKPINKFIIATATVAVSSGVIIGGIKLYAANNELGLYSIQIQNREQNFVTNKNQIALAAFLTAQGEQVANFDLKAIDDKSIEKPIVLAAEQPGTTRRFTSEQFLNYFVERFDRQTPTFIVQIGQMTFVNEYWDALDPQEFIEYARWFINNVSWGPDAISLQRFALKRGVTRSGNNLLLGQHNSQRKEDTRIEFFPDSFFGSFPIHSDISGKGNAPDNLTYKIFNTPLSKEQLDLYLNTIPQQQVLTNWDKNHSIGGIPATNLLINQKFYKYDLNKILLDTFANIAEKQTDVVEQTTQSQQNQAASTPKTQDVISQEITKKLESLKNKNDDFIIAVDESLSLEDIKVKFSAAALILADTLKLQLPKDFSLIFDDSLLQQKYTLKAIEKDPNFPSVDSEGLPQANITFSFQLDGENQQTTLETQNGALQRQQEGEQTQEASEATTYQKTFFINQEKTVNLTSLLVAELNLIIKKEVDKIVKNGFYDLYNINQGLNQKIGIYQGENQQFAKFFPLDEQSDSLHAQYEYLSNFNSKYYQSATIIKTEKVSPTVFELTVQFEDKSEKTFTFNLDSKAADFEAQLEAFRSYKIAIGFLNRSVPRVIQEVDTTIDGKATTLYNIYTDVFDNLIDTVLKNKPFVASKLNGSYLDSQIDATTGLKSFSHKRGEHFGFSPESRISYISLLKASTPEFKTTGINYLKYVGAHEYGHHHTLQYAFNVSDPKNNIIINALPSVGQPSVQSLYNIDALQLYLDARSSGLKIEKGTPKGETDQQGVFPVFSYDNNKNKNSRFETTSDIFGSSENRNVDNVIADPTRRFLQTFDGLKQAAKLRNLKLYDLFLLNSIDAESGTINPGIEGRAKFFRHSDKLIQQIANSSGAQELQTSSNDNKQEDKKETDGFVDAREIKELYSDSIKDGLGNIIEFNDRGEPIVAEFENNGDGTFSDLKVKIFYPNGQPVIDVKTFKKEDSLQELQTNISAVQKRFRDQIVTNFNNNGWNTTKNFTNKFVLSTPEYKDTLEQILSNPIVKSAYVGTSLDKKSSLDINNLEVKLNIDEKAYDVYKFFSELDNKTFTRNTSDTLYTVFNFFKTRLAAIKSGDITEDKLKKAKNSRPQRPDIFAQFDIDEIKQIVQAKSLSIDKLLPILKQNSQSLNSNLNTTLLSQLTNFGFQRSDDLLKKLNSIGSFEDSLIRKMSSVLESIIFYKTRQLNSILDIFKYAIEQQLSTQRTRIPTGQRQDLARIRRVISIGINLLKERFRTKLFQSLSQNANSIFQFAAKDSQQKYSSDKIFSFVGSDLNDYLRRFDLKIDLTKQSLTSSQAQTQEIYLARSAVFFGSQPYGKLIQGNSASYYQNPKYDYFAQVNSRFSSTVDQSEFKENVPFSSLNRIAPLANLLKLNQIVAEITPSKNPTPPAPKTATKQEEKKTTRIFWFSIWVFIQNKY
ncbi:Uncharacterised protein [Mesomycoplasma conjunctivae]|uniref:PDxFFG protein n=1 Tax=Mesomycoplasma conjunctivae (strain ATCC 25834 / NCTC 10147 / HRC/581) TaxID=572263 RepID=C5J6N5_MESCH|nr:PDxFFG protein [Mesomycoplasma conjunctivae]CAT05142.1 HYPOTHETICAL PROTEIN MCJ_004420 [Mesomycoplasma conjunctivae]VEU66156.1 Uncharacterised protein [Mesomycoplasma conjunctivae]